MNEQKPIREQVERIVKEFQNAGASKWTAIKIIKELENEKLSDKKLIEHSFELLKKLDRQAAEVYDSFQKMKVYNSQEFLNPFDRGNIIRSLLKETSLSRTIAEKIGADVENKLKDLKLEYLNTSLIREIVAVKLLDYGQENAHKEYTRIGMPIFEVQKNLNKTEIFRNEILKEYTWLKIIPTELKNLHFKSVIHITNVEDFCTKPYSRKFFFEPKINQIEKQLIELGGTISKYQKQVSKGIFIKSINNSFAQVLEKVSSKKLDFFAELLLMQLRESFSNPEKENFVGIDLSDFGEFKQNRVQKEKSSEFAQKIIKHYSSNKESFNFNLTVSMDSKYKLKLIEKPHMRRIYYLNCFEKTLALFPGLIQSENLSGISTFVGINLPKIASGASGIEDYKERLSKICKQLDKLFVLKMSIQSEQNQIGDNFSPAIGLYELIEASYTFGAKNFENFFEKTIKTIQKNCGQKILISWFQNNEGIKKFVAANKKQYELEQVDLNLIEKILLEKQFKKVFIAKSETELEDLFSKKAGVIYFGLATSIFYD